MNIIVEYLYVQMTVNFVPKWFYEFCFAGYTEKKYVYILAHFFGNLLGNN